MFIQRKVAWQRRCSGNLEILGVALAYEAAKALRKFLDNLKAESNDCDQNIAVNEDIQPVPTQVGSTEAWNLLNCPNA